MSSEKVSFSITEPRFDKNTYWGRVAAISASVQPKNAFKTKSQIQEYQKLLAAQKAKEQDQFEKTGSYKTEMSAAEMESLVNADNICGAAVHPDTNEALPWIMRISSFMPMNIPLNVGFILIPPTLINTVGVHVANQSYNATMNFGNANMSSPYTKEDITKGAAAAVSSSVAVALTIRQINLKRSAAATGATLILLNAFTSTVACAVGGFANNWFMRSAEMERGIMLNDPDTGKEVGKSKIAAKTAVMQTASSRIFMAMPIAIPAFALIGMERLRIYPSNRYLQMMIQLGLISGQLMLAVPCSMGAFPQTMTIKTSDLEPEFQGLKSQVKNNPITEFSFNKGL